jgi:hypothetical protein
LGIATKIVPTNEWVKDINISLFLITEYVKKMTKTLIIQFFWISIISE